MPIHNATAFLDLLSGYGFTNTDNISEILNSEGLEKLLKIVDAVDKVIDLNLRKRDINDLLEKESKDALEKDQGPTIYQMLGKSDEHTATEKAVSQVLGGIQADPNKPSKSSSDAPTTTIH